MVEKEIDYTAMKPKKGKLARKLLKIALIYILIDNVVSNYAKYRKKRNEKLEEENKDSAYKTYDLFMNSKEIKIGDERFSGANIKNCLGGVNLDLQELKMNSDVFLNFTNVFGGISVKVPYGVNVKCDGKCLFGGISNTVPEYEGEEVHTIYIEAKVTFGGLALNAAKCMDETVEDMFEEGAIENLSRKMDVASEKSTLKEMNEENKSDTAKELNEDGEADAAKICAEQQDGTEDITGAAAAKEIDAQRENQMRDEM